MAQTGGEHVLAIDLGTGGPKVALVGVDGSIAACATGSTRLLLGPGGAAEQDPQDWWDAITSAVRQVLAARTVPLEAVVGIAVTGQWSGTVPVGADGRPLMNAVIWMDSRGARYVDELVGGTVRVAGYGVPRLWRFVSRAGGLPTHSGKDPAAHIAWLRHERPSVYYSAAAFLEPVDYLNLRLTGRMCSSYDAIALHWVTDNRDITRVRYDDELLRLAWLERQQLPELVPSATVVGELRGDVAADWGLPAGVPVVTAHGDIPTAVLGSGAVAPYDGHLYLGTSSWLSCHLTHKRTDVLHNQTAVPAAVPGRYLLLNEQETAGACLETVARTVGAPEGSRGADVHAALEALATSAPPGARRVVFTPWLNGERTPVDDHTLRAAFLNLSLSTSRADLVRAVYEGVALNSRWLLQTVQHFTRHRIPELALIGGGARSAFWAQLHADVLGVPVRRPADPVMANVRGAAFVGLLALGLARIEELPGKVPIAARHEPDSRHRDVYDDLFEAFTDAYRRTHRIYARLNGR